MQGKYDLHETERNNELIHLRLEAAKKSEELKLVSELNKTSAAELDAKSKEVLLLETRLTTMEGEFRLLRDQEGQADLDGRQLRQLQEKLNVLMNERTEAQEYIRSLELAKEQVNTQIEELRLNYNSLDRDWSRKAEQLKRHGEMQLQSAVLAERANWEKRILQTATHGALNQNEFIRLQQSVMQDEYGAGE